MPLIARLATMDGEPIESRAMVGPSLLIGRGSGNDWVLPDPERTLSKHHCRVDRFGADYWLTDTSTNGVFVGDEDQALGRDASRVLRDGDVFSVGPYLVEVAITADEPYPVPTPPHDALAAPDDVIQLLPQDAGPAVAASEDFALAPDGADAPAAWAEPLHWDAPPEPELLSAPTPDPLPEPLQATSQVFDLHETQQPLSAHWVDEPAPATGGDTHPLLAAFLAGAGLPPHILAGADPDAVMGELGRLVRVSVGGVRDILTTRAMVEAEFQVTRRALRPAGGNPLKVAADLPHCLAAIIGGGHGSASMADSLQEIKMHELAMVTAMTDVFRDLAAILDPAAIRRAVDQDGGLTVMVPTARQARCWAKYEANHDALSEGSDTPSTMLAMFAQAYARHMRGTA